MLPGLPIPALAALATAITQAISALAQSVGLSYGGDRLRRFFGDIATDRALKQAILNAYQMFRQAVHNQALLKALDGDSSFWHRPDVLALLGDIAATPAYRYEKIDQLGTIMHALAPQVSRAQCQQAARVLAECLHAEVLSIPSLRDELANIQQEAMNHHLAQLVELLTPLPPYENELDRHLIAEARRVARQFHHGYVTTAHLLYAMVRATGSTTREAFKRLSVTPSALYVTLGWIKSHEGAAQAGLTESVQAALLGGRRLAGQHGATTADDASLLEALLEQVDRHEQHGRALQVIFEHLHLTTARIRSTLATVVPQFSDVHSPQSISQMDTIVTFDPEDQG